MVGQLPQLSDSTSRRLADLQPAIFEQLASSVLRLHTPYESLIPVGLNKRGRPVPSPVDAVCWIPNTDPPQGALFAYTSTDRRNLRGKWLGPEGDVVKALRRAEEIRQEIPQAALTLVLSCTVDPPEALTTTVKARCLEAGVEVDFWTAFRLVEFLDRDPQGQWLRQEFLKIPALSISWELLRDLSDRSLHSYGAFIFEDAAEPRVERELDRRLWEEACRAGGGVRFLVAESGHGKSSAGLALLRKHKAAGGCSLWLRPEDAALGGSVEVAIEAALRRLQPELHAGCGADALRAASSDPGLFLVVDDPSRYTAPTNLLLQIASWGGYQETSNGSREATRSWFLLCPIWPRFLSLLPETALKSFQVMCLYGGAYTPEEGAAVLRARAGRAAIALTELEAGQLSESLGHDPLLLSLLDFGSKDSREWSGNRPVNLEVIDRFLDQQRSRLTQEAQRFTVSDYEDALLDLADKMLTERELIPTWRRVRFWFRSSTDNVEALRQICADRQIAHSLREGGEEVFQFRHDRVRDAILAAALARSMKDGALAEEILREPFYAELLGQALLAPDIQPIWINRLREHNSLALFRALQLFQTPHGRFQEAIVTALRAWLSEEVSTGHALDALRWEAVRFLTETDSPLVLELGRSFPDNWHGVHQALFRNGDVAAAISYCTYMGLGVSYSGFVHLLEHVKVKFGRSFTAGLDTALTQSNMSKDQLRGALVLAGHLAEQALAPAVRSAWEREAENQMPLLVVFLWAGLRCLPESADEAAHLIDPIFETWRTLPNESPIPNRAPENTEVIRSLREAIFLRGLGRHAVSALIRRAIGSLEWPITVLCSHIDAPEALEFAVRQAAAISGYWDPAWAWDHRDIHGRHLGMASIGRLEELWRSRSEGERLRTKAFHFWRVATEASGSAVLELLRTVGASEPFYSDALLYRIRQGDQTAGVELIRMTETDAHPHIWWQYAHRIWNETLRDALDSFLGRLPEDGRAGDWEWEGHHFCAAEVLIEIPAADAEALLLRHWEDLRYRSIFVQAALAVATPRCLERVAEAVRDCPNPRRLLEHFEDHSGVRTVGRGQQFGSRQMEAILPYLNLFSEDALENLWLHCNEQGWFEYRRQHLDSCLTAKQRRRFWLERDGLFEELDRYLGEKRSPWSIDLNIKRFQDHGETWEEFLEALLAWLRERRALQALSVVARALVWAGRRTDLALLSGLAIEGDPIEVRQTLDRTAFQLFRRRLR